MYCVNGAQFGIWELIAEVWMRFFFDFAIRFMTWLKENEEMQHHSSSHSPHNRYFFSDFSDHDHDIRLHAFILNMWLELAPTRQKQFKNTETNIWIPTHVLSCSSVLGTVSNALLTSYSSSSSIESLLIGPWGDSLHRKENWWRAYNWYQLRPVLNPVLEPGMAEQTSNPSAHQ